MQVKSERVISGLALDFQACPEQANAQQRLFSNRARTSIASSRSSVSINKSHSSVATNV